ERHGADHGRLDRRRPRHRQAHHELLLRELHRGEARQAEHLAHRRGDDAARAALDVHGGLVLRHPKPPTKNERGAVVVLVALLIVPFTLLMAFAIDTGNWWVHKRHLQTQADGGTLAGALGPWAPFCDEASIEKSALDYG